MKKNEKTRDIWYQLDNAANIFPAISDELNTNVFRLSCDLKEPVDKDVLQQALAVSVKSFPYFQVVMRRGLFWFYLERTTLEPIVQYENQRPCSQIFFKNIKDLLFRVTYFGPRINLEVFHAVSDGSGAFELLRALVYNYLLIIHRQRLPQQLSALDKEPAPAAQSADSFQHYYTRAQKNNMFSTKAYTISGTLLPKGNIKVINLSLSTKEILALAKQKKVTVTAYIAALMICAIYQELMPKRAAGRTIALTVPVDLRSHFTSETSRNFFSVVDVGYNFAQQSGEFEDVLQSVTDQLREKINQNALAGRIGYTMSVQKNIVARFTPLVLKNLVLKGAYHKVETATTGALSNLGRITMPEPFDEYIDSFSCLLNPTLIHRFKASICSFGDRFIISFTSCIAETSAQKYIVRHLTGLGLHVVVTCNGGDDYEVL